MTDDRDLLLVCGCTRSGMTLTMQMLQAGGYPVHGTFPAYEDFGLGEFPEADNCAIKIPDPKYWEIPLARCSAIYCKRDRTVQAKSMIRWLQALGVPIRGGARKLATSIGDDDASMRERFHGAGVPVLQQEFDRLVMEPRVCAARIQEFVGRPLDIAPMVAALRPRPRGARLNPTLIELELLDGHK